MDMLIKIYFLSKWIFLFITKFFLLLWFGLLEKSIDFLSVAMVTNEFKQYLNHFPPLITIPTRLQKELNIYLNPIYFVVVTEVDGFPTVEDSFFPYCLFVYSKMLKFPERTARYLFKYFLFPHLI